MKPTLLLPLFAAILTNGCATPSGPKADVEKGQYNTIAYHVPVESNPPGVKIEVNYSPAGVTPLTLKIFGDKDGTFHNFGNDEYIVRAYPPGTNDFPQTKIFKTGAFSIKDDKIPEKIFFDFSSGTDKH
jgi:hypothetical protein